MSFLDVFIEIPKDVQSECQRHLTRKEGKAEQLLAIPKWETRKNGGFAYE